jgi:hypothetical protein
MDRFSLIVGVAGILALIFAVPMSIVANLVTPRIRSWWGARSQGRALVRISELKQVLALNRGDYIVALARARTAAVGAGVIFFIGITVSYFEGLLYVLANNGFDTSFLGLTGPRWAFPFAVITPFVAGWLAEISLLKHVAVAQHYSCMLSPRYSAEKRHRWTSEVDSLQKEWAIEPSDTVGELGEKSQSSVGSPS